MTHLSKRGGAGVDSSWLAWGHTAWVHSTLSLAQSFLHGELLLHGDSFPMGHAPLLLGGWLYDTPVRRDGRSDTCSRTRVETFSSSSRAGRASSATGRERRHELARRDDSEAQHLTRFVARGV